MNILKQSRDNLSTEDKYNLCMSPEIEKLSNVKGQTISVGDWILYEDVKKNDNGQEKYETILSIRTEDGEVFATNSTTFQRAFDEMIDLFASSGETVKFVKVGTGTSKNGRDYITAIYANSL